MAGVKILAQALRPLDASDDHGRVPLVGVDVVGALVPVDVVEAKGAAGQQDGEQRQDDGPLAATLSDCALSFSVNISLSQVQVAQGRSITLFRRRVQTAKPCRRPQTVARFRPGGRNRARTCDLFLVREALSRLSYSPTTRWTLYSQTAGLSIDTAPVPCYAQVRRT